MYRFWKFFLMQKILKDLSKDEVSDLRSIYKICQNERNVANFCYENGKNQKDATFEKSSKISNLQFWSTFFDLLTFSYSSTHFLVRISHRVFADMTR